MLGLAFGCFFIALVAMMLGLQGVAEMPTGAASLVAVVAVTVVLIGATMLGRAPLR